MLAVAFLLGLSEILHFKLQSVDLLLQFISFMSHIVQLLVLFVTFRLSLGL